MMLKVKFIFMVIFASCSAQNCDITFKNVQVQIKKNGTTFERITGCITPESLENYQPNTIVHMQIIGRNIPILHESAVANISDAFTIIFRENLLHTIKGGAFFNLSGIKRIHVTDNELRVIEERAFSDLPELKEINLSKNKITFFEAGTFSNLPELRTVQLEHNQLEHFEQEWFVNTPKLQYVEASYNSILALPRAFFANHPSIEWIELKYNKMQQIHRNAFEGLEKLILLDLSYNRLKSFKLDLTPLKNIQELLVHMNNLTYIPDQVLKDIVPSIRYFIAFPNPLQCNCYSKLSEWGFENNIKIGGYSTQCIIKNNPVCVVPAYKTTECIENFDRDTNEYLSMKFYEKFNHSCQG